MHIKYVLAGNECRCYSPDAKWHSTEIGLVDKLNAVHCSCVWYDNETILQFFFLYCLQRWCCGWFPNWTKNIKKICWKPYSTIENLNNFHRIEKSVHAEKCALASSVNNNMATKWDMEIQMRRGQSKHKNVVNITGQICTFESFQNISEERCREKRGRDKKENRQRYGEN